MNHNEFDAETRPICGEIEALLLKHGMTEENGYVCTLIITKPDEGGRHMRHMSNAACPSCHAGDFADHVPCVQPAPGTVKH